MAQIIANPKELETQANELLGMKSNLKCEVDYLAKLENSLSQMWEGPARDEFHTYFTKDYNQMIQFYNLIEQYAKTLLNIAAEYDKAETASKIIAQ